MHRNPKNAALLSLDDAGRMMSVHPETLRKRAEKGEVPHVRLGDRWLIPRQWLVDVANGNAAAWQPNGHGGLSRVANWNPFAEDPAAFRISNHPGPYTPVGESEPADASEADQ
jgi:excisionase family DNA binding protein